MTSLTPTNRQGPLHFIETVAFIIAQISVGECLGKKVFVKIHVFLLTMAPTIGVNLRVTGHCDQVNCLKTPWGCGNA